MAETQLDVLDAEIRRLVDAARGVWIRRLIDHSRANSLLFYRDLRVGTLDLTEEQSAVERLLRGESLTVDALIPNAQQSESQDSVVRIRAETEARQKARRALVALQRKALSNLEEKGIETLHLALGLATWPALDGGRCYDAPVLLLPAQIETRGRAGGDLHLAVAGEPKINPVLLHVLEENYSLRLNAQGILEECAGEDEAGAWRIDLECIFGRVIREASGVPEFDVRRRVIVANFQFAKMAMVEDIKKNGDAIAKSALVRAVAGHQESRRQLSEAVSDIEPASLDERPPRDEFLVLDADSTQQRAIVLAGNGQNGILQGPPGTGKSQTIANLIAQSVADGRRVLFVAEKRAALDAVMKRLSHPDVGLGHLVLDLHGASVSRKAVMARLGEALEEIRHSQPPEGVEAVHREYEARRRQLTDHAHRINVRREPTGMSVNGLIGRLLRLPKQATSALRLRGDVQAQLTAERADTIKQWILEGTAHPTLLLGTDPSPWNNAEVRDGSRAQEALDLAGKTARELWPVFEELLGQFVHRLGVPPPTTMSDIGAMLGVLRDVRRVRSHYRPEVLMEPADDLATALEPAGRGRMAVVRAFLSSPEFRAARRRLQGLRRTAAPVGTLLDDARLVADIRRRWRELGTVSEVPVEAQGETEFAAAYVRLREATDALGAVIEAGSFDTMPLPTAAALLSELAGDARTPYLLPGVHDVRSRLSEAGLSRLLTDFREHSVRPEDWTARFDYVWLYSSLEQALASDPALAAFNGRTHEQLVADFVRLDRQRVRLAAQRARRLHAERAIEAQNGHFEQANLVRGEARKKSRHIPLRELLARAPDVLTRVAPCWIASPLSVSQLLDGGQRHFDLVLFDEASQVLQEEAIPALYRAGQVVVAGDRHQLPPTTFFATAVEGEDDLELDEPEDAEALKVATAAIGGYESLLGTLESFLSNWLLEWHYRSEDERLIAFSNAHIYSNRLVTFPSARGHDAIAHVLVPHDPSGGGQAESASPEVEEVVRQVLRHAEQRPTESLGVIAMGIKHANRVQAALDSMLELRPELMEFFSLDREERFFVKNLETVQGDERDAIILSVGYGRSANGDLPHRFGPLTQEAGYRRLNVAVTRAKRRMIVVSSFAHHDIDLNRSGGRGVQLLKAYLEYAASGGARLPQPEHAGEVDPNSFEADIRDALDGRGIQTRPQFGASRYRIDLVAMHPDRPGRPVLAIECDGATYHSSATARDRDRLRQAHLQSLGWRFHRIWSTDWFFSREEEIERALAAFRDAVLRADREDAEAEGPVARPVPLDPPPPPVTHSEARPNRDRGPRPLLPIRESIDHYADRELRRLAEWVTSDGLLRTEEEMVREMFEALPFRRLGGKIRSRLQRAALHVGHADRRGR